MGAKGWAGSPFDCVNVTAVPPEGHRRHVSVIKGACVREGGGDGKKATDVFAPATPLEASQMYIRVNLTTQAAARTF